MGRPVKNSLSIIHPEGRRYACRDCPARCCTSSWGFPVSAEECERILGDDVARSRLDERSIAILRAGVLPMREEKQNLACIFLDEDHLCSLHKRHGHTFLPASCQTYPFGFSQNESGNPVALLSRYCPSIRDNYGEPVEEVVADKWKQAGEAALPMADKVGLRSGRTLPRSQYVEVIRLWERTLGEDRDPASALALLYDRADQMDERLPPNQRPSDQQLRVAIAEASIVEESPLTPGRLSFAGRMLVAHLLGGICYPSRVMLAHRLKKTTFWERIRSWMNRLVWLFGWGRVNLLFVERPVRMKEARRVAPFLRGPLGRIVSEYLLEVLQRRQGFTKQVYLVRVLVDLALMTTLISRYARAAASTQGSVVLERHVREGIGIAELLFTHQGDSGQSMVLHHLRLVLMSNRDDFRRILATEL